MYFFNTNIDKLIILWFHNILTDKNKLYNYMINN